VYCIPVYYLEEIDGLSQGWVTANLKGLSDPEFEGECGTCTFSIGEFATKMFPDFRYSPRK
jgi:hypothetical protein